jgi:endonuclease/exonuclease/phosphatase family metal-dependent hydrolase
MSRTRTFSVIVLVTLFLLNAAPVVADDGSITVLSFNIRYDNPGDGENRWELRKEAVAMQIHEVDPDILCLQEALRHQLNDLHELVPGYEEVGVGRDDGVEAGEYCAILIRDGFRSIAESGTFWLSDTPDVPGSTSWGNNITRIATWAELEDSAGHVFTVYNTHLDHESQQSREFSADLLRRMIIHSGAGPFIIAGDFNAGEDNRAIQIMTTVYDNLPLVMPGPQSHLDEERRELDHFQPFRDSFRVLHPNADSVGTYNSWTGVRTGEKIDYVFVSKSIDVLDAGILHQPVNGRYTSDHFPVYARVLVGK